MLTEDTKNAILVIEAITPEQQERSLLAIKALQKKVKDIMNIEGTMSTVSPA